MRRATASIAVAAVVAACGGDDGGPVAEGSSSTTPSGRQYEATGTVLESADHGPQLCLGAVAASLPPQCGGPDLLGWDWAAVDGEESRNGTTWARLHVTVAVSGDDYTLVSSGPPREDVDRDPLPDLTAPCPEPSGGWKPVDPERTTEPAFGAANAYVQAQPDAAGFWVDYISDGSSEMADAGNMIAVARFTDDLSRHERELREVWGGALCVTDAEHTTTELRAIMTELSAELGPSGRLLGVNDDEVANTVTVEVTLDDGLQREMDRRYGPGLVEVRGQLQPVG